jgi:hypothetical protein
MYSFSLKIRRHLSSTEFVKWILPFCANIHTLQLHLVDEPNDLHKEIARLKKLKDLHIKTNDEIPPGEVTFVAFRIKTTLMTSL